jgi:uncharacterized SAM-binding protein YcdF (DUF218 family)
MPVKAEKKSAAKNLWSKISQGNFGRWIAAFAFLVVFVFTWAFVREMRLIRHQPISSWTDDSTADCAVVLTGGPNRIREGFDLLARQKVHKLIVSGVHPQAGIRDIMPLWPFYSEIREQDVVLERRSRTTYGNAQQTLQLVEALRCRDLILVTSRTHMRRALATFRAEFPTNMPIIPHAVISGSLEPSWSELTTETLKALFYSLWAY